MCQREGRVVPATVVDHIEAHRGDHQLFWEQKNWQGEAQECQSEGSAIRRAEGMPQDPANAGAVAFKRAGDPNVGEFSDAVVLKKFGDVPEDLSEL
jgi:hypothetical protein